MCQPPESHKASRHRDAGAVRLRAAVLASISATLVVGFHRAGGGQVVFPGSWSSGAALGLLGLMLGCVCVSSSRQEWSWGRLIGVLSAVQVAAHQLLVPEHELNPASAGHAGESHLGGLISGGSSLDLVPAAPMVVVHVLVTLIVAWSLRRGESTVAAIIWLARSFVAAVSGRITVAVRSQPSPPPPRTAPSAGITVRLQTCVRRRGPPEVRPI